MDRRAFLGCAGATALALAQRARAAEPRLNLVFILADDLGWRDLGCYGSTFYETPHLDALARRSVKLTQAYAASPLCSPTRSSILCGQYPARLGITAPVCHLPQVQLEKRLAAGGPQLKVLNADSLTRLRPDYVTLAEVLRGAGYRTAHFGKWHLGHNLPNRPDDHYEPRDQGFELDFPHTPAAAGPGGGYLAPWKFIKDPAITGARGEHIEDRLSAEAAKFVQAHRDEPFFLNYWAYSVHSPWNARRDYLDHFRAKVDPANPQHNPLYAAMVRSLDDGVGRLLAALETAGVAERTVVVFFSDNGGYSYPPKVTDPEGFEDQPATSNLPLRSGKASLYEGGTRECCLVRWPGRTQAGTTSDALLQSVDWYPTLLTMLGVPRPAGVQLDGLDQTAMLTGGPAVRDTVFCHFPHGSANQAAQIPGFLPGSYVRRGDWKLLRFFADNDDGSDRHELYNLQDDLGETRNLAAAQPALVRELGALLDGFLRDTQAVVPRRNPAYQATPADPLQGWKARGCDAAVHDGALTIKGTGPTPFLGVGAGWQGPFTVTFRARCAAGGDGQVERVAGAGQPPLGPTTPFKLAPGDWQEVTVRVEATGPTGILRLYLPAQTQPVEVAWIAVAAGRERRRWEFGRPAR